jgi:ubiquinone/menaquinone biosynthesis C-methylase UbiE
MNSDQTWEFFGRTEPYFAVLTRPEFKRSELNVEAKARFFESGTRYVDLVLQHVRETLDPSFRPTRALDFGCGVGRLSLPIARICQSVVGIDVSDSMIERARSNAAEFGITNATFVKGDDQLSAVSGTFDFLNSLIVFQHIPPARGEAILRALLRLLREDGVGALQFSYGFETSTPLWRQLLVRAYTKVPLLWSARNVVKRRPFSEPMMQMNEYDLNRLFCILHEAGCHLINTRFTETSSFGHRLYGVILVFQKKQIAGAEHA